METKTKFCKHCGETIDEDCVVCPKCGKQVEDLKNDNDKNVIINNNVSASASAQATAIAGGYGGKMVNQKTAFIMSICGGWFGLHKFYEGKIGMGILYFFTLGLFCIGWIIDIIAIAGKPKPYYYV